MNNIEIEVSNLDQVYDAVEEHGGDNGDEWLPGGTIDTKPSSCFLYAVKAADGAVLHFYGVDKYTADRIYESTF